MNVKQELLNAGINAFGLDLVCESLLKREGPIPTLDFFFPVNRSDCEAWAGVQIKMEPWPKGGPDERTATPMEAARAALNVIMAEACAELHFGEAGASKSLRRIARAVAGGFAGVEGDAAESWLKSYLASHEYPADLLDGEV